MMMGARHPLGEGEMVKAEEIGGSGSGSGGGGGGGNGGVAAPSEGGSAAANAGRQVTLAALRDAAGEPVVVRPGEKLNQVVVLFEQRPHCTAVMVTDGPSYLYVVSREWVAEQLARPYFRELFLNKALRELLRVCGSRPLQLAQSTPIPAAIEAALGRPATERYRPVVVVVVDRDGSVEPTDPRQPTAWLLDVHSLLLHQCKLLTMTLNDLEGQRRATQAAEAERERLQRRLITASREAGRAEVATGVLHNVGNVLNSVNVSASVIHKTLQHSKLANLAKAVALFDDHRERLPSFLTDDERGRRLPGYLAKLTDVLAREQRQIADEMTQLGHNLEHIRQVVQMQQSYATGSTVREPVHPWELMENAVRVNMVSFDRHNVQVVRHVAGEPAAAKAIPPIPLDKHKVLQILINLVGNAKNAVKGNLGPKPRQIELAIEQLDRSGAPWVRFVVRDNGMGIAPENLTRIFNHGFTTRKEGHGFGLHSAANFAREMNGSLTADSAGPGQGATFTLDLPIQAQDVSASQLVEKAAA